MAKKFPLGANPHADAFAQAENNLQLDKAGNGSYGIDHDSLMPLKRPQSPAQHNAVKKAAAASVAKRRGVKGPPAMPKMPKVAKGFLNGGF